MNLRLVILICLFSTQGLLAQSYIPYNENGTWRFMHISTGALSGERFEQAEYFRGGWALVKKNNFWGAVDSNLKMVIPFQYQELKYLSDDLVRGKRDDEYFLFHQKHKFRNPYVDAALLRGYDKLVVAADASGQYGLINLKGKPVVPFKYEAPPKELHPGIFLFALREKNNVSFGALNVEGKIIIPFGYLFVSKYGNDFLKAETATEQHIYTLDGQRTVMPAKEAYRINDYFSVVHRDDDKQAVYIRGKNEPFLFNHALFYDNLVIGRDAQNSSVIVNRDGDILKLKSGLRIQRMHHDMILICTELEKERCKSFGLMNASGGEILPPVYDEIQAWNEKYAVVTNYKKRKRGLVSLLNQDTVLDFIHDDIQLMECGFVKVITGKESKYLGKDFKEVNELAAQEIRAGDYLTFESRRAEELERKMPQKSGQKGWEFSFDCSVENRKPVAPEEVDLVLDHYGNNPLHNVIRIRFRDETNHYRWVLADMNGKVLNASPYTYMGYHDDSLIVIMRRQTIGTGSKSITGALDIYGNEVVAPVFEKFTEILPHAIIVTDRGVSGVIRRNGEVLIEPGYGNIRYDPAGFYLLGRFGKWSIADATGNLITPQKYDEILEVYPRGVFKVKRGQTVFFMDKNGREYLATP